MNHSRAFGTRRNQVPAADPTKHWEYLQWQNKQHQQKALANVPKGSRVFQRNRNLEEAVYLREEDMRRRQEEEAIKKQPPAIQLSRHFGASREIPSINLPSKTTVKQPPGRPFGLTRQRFEEEDEAAAMELQSPWSWQPPGTYEFEEVEEIDE